VADIGQAAYETFAARGWRRTRLIDVAEQLGLSHALLYKYVEGKEALLELAVRYAMDPAADLEAVTPLPTPSRGHILELIRRGLPVGGAFPVLRAALDAGPGGDAATELAGIIDELYGFVERNRLLLLLLERLVDDYPGLSSGGVGDRKRTHNALLAEFLASRAAGGGLRPLADPEIGAHFLRESVAWFAQHRQRDPDAAGIDDERARVAVRELLLAAFVPDPGSGR